MRRLVRSCAVQAMLIDEEHMEPKRHATLDAHTNIIMACHKPQSEMQQEGFTLARILTRCRPAESSMSRIAACRYHDLNKMSVQCVADYLCPVPLTVLHALSCRQLQTVLW